MNNSFKFFLEYYGILKNGKNDYNESNVLL